MISYLSQPIKSTVEPYHENVGLIAQVAQQKQNKYDNVLSTIFQKQNQLLNLDTSQGSEEAELKKDNLLKEADDQLNKFASSDLTIPDNISKVENIFTPIINDKDIMGAASITAFTKEQAAYFDEWKKEGKGLYDAKNEAYFLEQVQKNRKMTLQEVKQKGYKQPTSTEFVDIDKWYRDSIKELLPDVTMTVAPDGQGRIFTQKGKVVSEDRILAMLPTNSKIIAQAEINAHYDYAGVDKNQLLFAQQKSLISQRASVKGVMEQNTKQIEYLEDQLKNIEQDTPEGQKQVASTAFTKEQAIQQLKDKIEEYRSTNSEYDKQYKAYGTKINEFNATYKFNGGGFDEQLSEDQLKNLKTSTWLDNKKQQFAQAMSYSDREITVATDQVQLEYIKHQYDLESKQIDNTYQMMQDAAKDSRDPNKLHYDADGNLISGGNAVDAITAFGDTPANETTSEVDAPENGNEFKDLLTGFNEFTANLNNLPRKYIAEQKDKNSAYDEKMFEQDRAKYLRVLGEWDKNKSLKLTDKIGDTEQTYQQFFDANKDMKQFVINRDGMASIHNSHVAMITKIQQSAEKRALGESGYIKQPKDIVISTGISAAPAIKIPKSMYDRYITNTLTQKDYNDLRDINDYSFIENSDNPDKMIKHFTGLPTNDEKLEAYKSLNTRYRNEIAREYQKGYLTPGIYLKDITSEKSIGKVINNNTIQYLKTFSDAKFAKDDIEVKYFFRDSSSPSGWSVRFTTTGTQVDDKGATTKLAPVTDTKPLTSLFVKDYGINTIGDVSEISKNLNLQKIGEPNSKKQEFLYPYLGKFYKFVQTPEGVNVYEKTGDTTFKQLNSNPAGVDALTRMIVQLREQELNGKR